MDEKERNLKNAVHNAKSTFYAFKGNKSKQTRKEVRRAARASKKLKRHSQQTNQVEKKSPLPDKTRATMKKRKRKRKKKVVCEDEDLSYDKAAYEAANKIDEKLIASLGKKLGCNKKKDKLSSMFKEDGLDYILEVCESFTGEDAKGYGSDEEYLASKSKKIKKAKKEPDGTELSAKSIKDKLLFEDGNENDENVELQRNRLDEDDDDDDDVVGNDNDHHEDDVDAEDEIFDQVDDDDYEDEDEDDEDEDDEDEDEDDENDDKEDIDYPLGHYQDKANKDNSDQEDTPNKTSNKSCKYIPPALRNQSSNDNDKQQLKELRIKKQLKGLLNRLSDGTMISVVSEIETMYSNNSRNFMNEILCKMISESCVSTITMPEKLVIQHMVIVAALHIVIGSEIGGYFLQMLTERFSNLHGESPRYGEGKTCHNVLLMLVSLYNLKVVDSLLIYDLISSCLANFHEQDVELIFLILKSCGPDLRKDDPVALKDVIVSVHTKASEYPTEDKSYVNFMLETINALKNNNTRKIPLYDSTIVEDARKSLKTILQGKSKNMSDMKLKVSLEDMLNAEEKGRWWITGSAWSGRGPLETKPSDVVTDEMGFSATVLKAAKKQRMNTTVRKQIFCVMVSSEDYIDAFERLLKLNLTEKQFREVIHVLVDCCLQEKIYNPFYAHLANRLCEFNKSNQVTFQYSMWDRFKTMNSLKKLSLSNLEQFLAHMIASKSLSLSVLKIISFGALDQVSIKFFTSFFTIFLLQYPVNTIKSTFHRIANLPKLSLLRQGIKLFLRQYLYRERSKENVSGDVNNEKMKEIIDIVESAIDGCDYVPL